MIPGPSPRIVLATRPVDFRRGHDALTAAASLDLGVDIYSGVIVIFRSKRGDRLKILAWDGTGLVLTYKRLEEGRFAWPGIEDGTVSVLAVSDGAVIGLFDGFSVPIRTRPGRVSDGRRRVKPLRGSFASLRPFG